MNIATLKQAVLLCGQARVTPFIWGHAGIGKSSLVRQVAVANGMGFIDLRCSQLEASDLRGLPDKVDGRTCYLPPADMPSGDLSSDQIAAELGELPDENDMDAVRVYYSKLRKMQPRFQRGILFLDELNRGADDVLQAAFELVLDRHVGMYELPPGWIVVAAGNFMEGYVVSGFSDPAFLNRFCHLTLTSGESTLDEWVNYMSSVHGETASPIIEFASQNPKHRDGDRAGELGFSIVPSSRSWDAVARVLTQCKKGSYGDSTITEVIAGLVGRDLALAYTRYSCPVKPRDIINNGVKANGTKLKTLDRNQLTGLMWGLVSYCKPRITEESVAETCLDFADFMLKNNDDKDVVVAFCRALIQTGDADDKQDRARAAVLSNPRLAKLISEFSKKQPGDRQKSFIDRLTERPELQEILAHAAWGRDTDDDAKPAKKK